MGKVHYYSNEIEDRLRQVDINRNDIGMTQINVLPIPDGVLEGSGSSPRPIEFTAIGDKLSGKVSVEINGETNMLEHPSFTLGWLTPLGRGEDDTGTIKPGKYLISFTCSMAASQLIERLHNRDDDKGSGWITVEVHDSESSVSTIIELGETETITIPENFEEVRIYYDIWVNGDTMASEFDDDVTFDIYPFLRLKALADEPFEPYKPDLQTQINELKVPDLTKKVERLTDTVGTDGSINLFPIDKGTLEDPVIVEGVGGNFYVNQGNNSIPPFITFEGKNDTSEQSEYKVFFNHGYRWDDNPFLFGDLTPGDYVLSFDVLEDLGFSDVADFYFEIYEADSSSINYGDLIATCTGSDTEFTVTAAKPFITILAVAKLHDGESWVGDEIAVTPFLRRKAFVAAEYDRYEPSVIKRISEGDTKLQTEINEFKAANDNYLTPTYEGTLPLSVDGGAGGYADDWTIYGNNNYNPDSHNLLELAEGSRTEFGLTFTVDNEAGTITVDGTAETSASVYFLIHAAAGKHYLTGCPSGLTGCYASMRYPGSGTPLGPNVTNWDGSVTAMDTGDGDVEVLLIEGHNYLYYGLNVLSGASFDNVVFRPMIRRPDASPDFEPYTVGVGERTKNSLDLNKYYYSSGISDLVIDEPDGDLSFTGTGVNRGVNFFAADLGVEMYGKTYTVSCVNNLVSTEGGRIAIRKTTTNQIVERVGFDTIGNKSITFTPDEETFPDGWYISVLATGSTSTTGNVDISQLMLRLADTTPNFEPYGYKIPIVSNNKTTDIFIGSEPLTSGKKVTRSSTGAEIPLKAGVNVVDTSLFNKPRVDVKVDRLKNIEQALAGGGYNETQTENITDNVREVIE